MIAYRVEDLIAYLPVDNDLSGTQHSQVLRDVGLLDAELFDELSSGDIGKDFGFVRAVGEAFLSVYPSIIARRKARV